MITQGTALLGRARRCLSPTEWFVRWFRLPQGDTTPDDRGLVLIQIDGLSRRELDRAMENRRVPFLASLLKQEHYVVHDLYSGLPASTPGVQGELFYGPKCAVPAFGFRDHRTGKVVRMFAQDVAAKIESKLADGRSGLLQEGSAYCNIYTGGAAEAHYCASNLGWSELMSSVRLWKLVPFLAWHGLSVLRVVALVLIEFVLACLCFVKGAVTKREYWQELLMIPARVVVVILMRELATIGATMDVTRGLPVVQLNLLGYDEQAHRRGPASDFAHWTLKGVDDAIRRIWRSAHRSGRREYDVWIYSDHGQVTTTAFEYACGQSIEQLTADLVREVCPAVANGDAESMATAEPASDSPGPDTRAAWVSAGWIVGKLFGEGVAPKTLEDDPAQVAALGPLGFIYTNRSLAPDLKLKLAERFVERGVPLALIAESTRTIGVTSAGRFDLQQEPEKIFGSDHPFLPEIADDMSRLVHHPDAGDVVVSGWVRGGGSLSFAVQSGAHAGPSPEETGAFVMAPRDVPLEQPRGFLRPNDLRLAAQNVLHPEPPQIAFDESSTRVSRLRIMTYNVHACVGMDHRLDVRRIARVIAQSDADIVALQELDVCRARSGFRDQAEEIARLLEVQCQFHPAWQLAEERYGDAILSRLPMQSVRSGGLPARSAKHEPRGAIWVEVEPEPDVKLQIINTHLSLYPQERLEQSRALVREWIADASQRGMTVLCGDFNAQPSSPSYRSLKDVLRDVQHYGARRKAAATFFSSRPLARIDHIFVSDELEVEHAHVVASRLAKVASDHLPLIADLAWETDRQHQDSIPRCSAEMPEQTRTAVRPPHDRNPHLRTSGP